MSGMELKRKLFLGSIMVCIIIVVTLVYRSKLNYTYLERPATDLSSQLSSHLDIGNITKKETSDKIIILAKVIKNAKKHVRGSKTSDYLKKAISIMNDILKDIDVNAARVYERSSVKSTSTCSESFKGGDFGFPLYYKGWETDSCAYSVSVSSLVTVIKYIDVKPNDVESTLARLDQFFSSVNASMHNVSTLIAVNSATFPNIKTKFPLMNIVQSKHQSEGSALNSLVLKVKTPYVLVARNIDFMTNDSRLERLVREIESLNVIAAGGAFRDSNGHWKKGCFQSVYRNYTLKYIEGYDESFHECLFCDYIHGPFVTTTNYLKQNAFEEIDENNGLYEDWFLRIVKKGQETIVCPDSMFNVAIQNAQSDSNWKTFSQKWNVLKVFTPRGYTVTQSCEKQKTPSRASRALSPCALQKNNDAVKIIMRKCEETGVICELQEGTALGGVKFGRVIPWEFDFDIRFLATNCSKCKQLENALKKTTGLKVDALSSSCCNKKLKLGEIITFAIHYKDYQGDFFTGHPVMDSDRLIKAGLTPTKVLFDGQWVNVPRNPGMFVRNRYGKEIYQHAEHWRYSGGGIKNHRLNYTTNMFLPCKQPGGHDCLDRYNADGDLPFVEVLP